ncbi:MAG: glycosyltransferase [Candidatus Adiutrix sp.]|jgi:hypothetical protein|nr:glycosyltransferase [Candidatus Adiutrix sp.]
MNKIAAGTDLIFREENPDGVTAADIVVVVPSYKEAPHIGLPVKKASLGLTKHYPQLRSVIINCDNCSDDGTEAAFFNAESEVPRIYVSSPPGVRGKGANLVNAFRKAAALSPRAVLMLDANLLSVKTTWIPRLADPILNGTAEYVSPIYVRHKYDGPISRGLATPLLRALFGRRVLQPIHVDHAFSGRLNEIYLNSDWDLDDRGYKSDMFMLATAIMNNAPVCQSFLAYPRTTTLKKLDYDLSRSFSHVAGALFRLMLETDNFWTNLSRTRPTIMACGDDEPQMPPPQVELQPEALTETFLASGRAQQGRWAEFMPPDLCEFLESQLTLAANGGMPVIPMYWWRAAVFEAALAFKRAGSAPEPEARRDAVTAALAPLFVLRMLTVYTDSTQMTERQYNALLEDEALSFENGKKELTERWKNS